MNNILHLIWNIVFHIMCFAHKRGYAYDDDDVIVSNPPPVFDNEVETGSVCLSASSGTHQKRKQPVSGSEGADRKSKNVDASKKAPHSGNRVAMRAEGYIDALKNMQAEVQASRFAYEESMQRKWMEHEQEKERERRRLDEDLEERRRATEEATEERRVKQDEETRYVDQEFQQRLFKESQHTQCLQQNNTEFMAAILSKLQKN